MDLKERFESPVEALIGALDGRQAEIYTALPGVVLSFNAEAQTCEVQPMIQARLKSPLTGEHYWVSLPPLLDCPVHFPAGGGYTLTFPIAPGDECLVIFSSRCIDAWWQNGGGADGTTPQEQSLIRMHDLSDGFVFAGVRSRPRFLANVSTTSVQLRSDDGLAYCEIHGHDITAVSPTKVQVDAPVVTVNSTTTTINATTAIVNATTVDVNASGNASVNAGGAAEVTAGGALTLKGASIVLKNAGAALRGLVTSIFFDLYNNHRHTFDLTVPEGGAVFTGVQTSVPSGTPAGAGQATTVVTGE